jgi:hypothetical protein
MAQMAFAEHHDMVEAFPADRADYGLRFDDCKCAIHLGEQSAEASQYQPVNGNLLGLARRSCVYRESKSERIDDEVRPR